jgi:hypothetical protein
MFRTSVKIFFKCRTYICCFLRVCLLPQIKLNRVRCFIVSRENEVKVIGFRNFEMKISFSGSSQVSLKY